MKDIKMLIEAFFMFDQDGDGTITVKEVDNVFKQLGESRESAQQFINAIDLDGDGTIDMIEFITFLVESSTNLQEFEASNFSEVFSIFDADKDGLISACDLRIALAKLGFEISSEDAANMIQVETHNGSDYLTYLEFFKIIQGKNFNNFAKKIDMRKSV